MPQLADKQGRRPAAIASWFLYPPNPNPPMSYLSTDRSG